MDENNTTAAQPTKRRGRPPGSKAVDQTAVALTQVTDALKGISDRLTALESKPAETAPYSTHVSVTPNVATPSNSMGKINWTGGINDHLPTTTVIPKNASQFRDMTPEQMPPDYLTARDAILGADFGLKIELFNDRPEMMVHVIVPEKYSNMSPDQRNVIDMDIRSRVISYAEGLEGIKAWFELIRQNLSLNKLPRPVGA